MSFRLFLSEQEITQEQFDKLEEYLDHIFKSLGIDVKFTRHFMDRVNDARNGKQITVSELANLFSLEYTKWGKDFRNLKPETESVMRQKARELNLPFVVGVDRYKKRGLQLRPITVMRKKDFKTHNKVFDV